MSAPFEGYSFRNVYPNWGASDQKEETIPEVAEQQAYAQVDPATTTTGVHKTTKMNIWILLGALVIIVVLFGKG